MRGPRASRMRRAANKTESTTLPDVALLIDWENVYYTLRQHTTGPLPSSLAILQAILGKAAEFGPVLLLDRREERVEVDGEVPQRHGATIGGSREASTPRGHVAAGRPYSSAPALHQELTAIRLDCVGTVKAMS